jgi:hypothetical protein
MELETRGGRQTLAMVASVSRSAWLHIVLLLLVVAMIAFGIYLNSQPGWLSGKGAKLYNKGVTTLQQPATELLPADGDRPEEYPIVRAVAYFKQAAEDSSSDSMESLALYNLGTVMGGNALSVVSGNTPRFSLDEAISRLVESVRLDPDNENAKYNLELLQEVQNVLTPQSTTVMVPGSSAGGGSSGFAGGVVHKGY